VDLHLPDDCVSRRHAEVRVAGPGLLRVRDLGSRNGTWVRGRRVRSRLLHPGDRIEIGEGNLLRAAWLDPIEERFHRQLEEAALRDVLTPAYNRRYLRQRLCSELAFAQRHGTPVALLVIDVDHFKQVNDCYGHLTGDTILTEVARTLLAELRSEDVLARWGGEEFAVLCHSTTELPALVLGERIRHRVAATRFAHGQPLHVSIGIATYPAEGRPLLPARSTVPGSALADRLIGSADEALYHAKRNGRNQVVMHTEV
jgi:diguanylate cyclase (GGDEF)-like protein